jgi:hypothetical protein
LWISPILETDPGITATDTVATTPTFNRFALRQPSTDTMGDFSIDNLIVTTTFAEVVPEPVMTLFLLISTGALLTRRRRS